MSQRARDGGATMLSRMYGRYFLLQYLHFHRPWWSYVAESQGWRCDDVSIDHL